MIYHVRHVTIYDYAEPTSACHNQLHLHPRDRPGQRCVQSSIHVHPGPVTLVEHTDFFGNIVHSFVLSTPTRQLWIESSSQLQVDRGTPLKEIAPVAWETVRDRIATGTDPDCLEATHFIFASAYVEPSDALAEYASASFAPGMDLLRAVVDLTARIHTDFKFDADATTVGTSLDQVLTDRRGVCQDFAHLQIGCLRSLGLPARYVSGYISTTPPPGMPRLVGADASHAWCSVWIPGVGWIDFDPTNNLVVSDQHVTVAWGRDYGEVSPVKGVVSGGGNHATRVGVDVFPVTDPTLSSL